MRFFRKAVAPVLIIALSGILSVVASYNIDVFLSSGKLPDDPFSIKSATKQISEVKSAAQMTVIVFTGCLLVFGIAIYYTQLNHYHNKTVRITPDIEIPEVSGNGEHGTAKFLDKKAYKKAFEVVDLSDNLTINELIVHGYDVIDGQTAPLENIADKVIPKGGLLVGKDKSKDKYYIVSSDTHTLTIGTTRSGKTRTVSLMSICMQALAGESMITVDPKGEMFLYTRYFLQRLGYEVIAIDFDAPSKSTCINFLQEVIDHVNKDDLSMAIQCARDIVATLVEDRAHGEPIWTNGERAVLTCAIMSVIWDNRDRPEYQNMANVYYFIARMCRPNKENIIPLSAYLHSIGEDTFHPAKLTIDVAEISPSKMRGSFYGAALTTLSLYVDPNIYGMMQSTEFNIYETSRKKRAIFIILPDERKTYHTQAALFITQEYQRLKQESKQNGNRLERRVNFNLEEFGNFAKISEIQSMLTVGGGAGIRFHLFLQSFAQFDDKYGRDIGQILRDNCETWIYLLTDNGGTLEELSKKLGNYTIKSPSSSYSQQGGGSTSYSLISRELLTTEEIKRIRRPYQLVTSRNDAAVMFAPDISKTLFNKMLGLGDEEFNKQLIIERQRDRVQRTIKYGDMKTLALEDYFPNGLPQASHEEEREVYNEKENSMQKISGFEKSILRPSSLKPPVSFHEIL